MFARRAGICHRHAIWEMDAAHVLQLMMADGIRNGMSYQWTNYFEPPPELMAEFDDIENLEPPEIE